MRCVLAISVPSVGHSRVQLISFFPTIKNLHIALSLWDIVFKKVSYLNFSFS